MPRSAKQSTQPQSRAFLQRAKKAPREAGAFCRSLRRCSLHRDHGDDHVRDRVYDHEFVIVDEAQVTAKFRLNEHDVLRNHEEVEPPWNSHAYIDIEVHIAYPKPRYEPAVKDHVLYPRPLLSGERNTALRTSLREPVRAGAADRSQVLPVHAPSFAEPAAPLLPESMAGPSPFTRRRARASTDAAVLPRHVPKLTAGPGLPEIWRVTASSAGKAAAGGPLT